MKTRISLIVGMVILVLPGYGQLRYPTGIVNVNTKAGGITEQIIPLITKKAELYEYVDKEFRIGSVYLKNGGKLLNRPIRYDLVNNQVEVKLEGAIRVAPSTLVKSFEWYDDSYNGKRYFVEYASFSNTKEIDLGFYELLTEGKVNLLRFYHYERLAPDYNPALDVGSRVPSILVSEVYYLSSNLELKEIPKNKKSFLEMFRNTAPYLNTLMKEKKLNHKKLNDLKIIIETVSETISKEKG